MSCMQINKNIMKKKKSGLRDLFYSSFVRPEKINVRPVARAAAVPFGPFTSSGLVGGEKRNGSDVVAWATFLARTPRPL